jgi:hypothetical protein
MLKKRRLYHKEDGSKDGESDEDFEVGVGEDGEVISSSRKRKRKFIVSDEEENYCGDDEEAGDTDYNANIDVEDIDDDAIETDFDDVDETKSDDDICDWDGNMTVYSFSKTYLMFFMFFIDINISFSFCSLYLY